MDNQNLTLLYDSISTYAIRWLSFNKDKYHKSIGIKNFNYKDKTHMWLLQMFKNYSIYHNYCDYYIQTNFLTYIYLRFIKKFKHLHKYKNQSIFLIDPNIFIKELVQTFNQGTNIIIDIYNTYYK